SRDIRLSDCRPLKVGLFPGRRTLVPAVGAGDHVVVLSPAVFDSVFFHRTISLCCSVDRYSTGPSGPVSVLPPGSLLRCPTGRRSACPSFLPWGFPSTKTDLSALITIVCGALASSLLSTFRPRFKISTVST